MLEKREIANLMKELVMNCNDCPLETICDESECADMWERFLRAKVHENNMHGGWIPIEERTPEDDRFILLSFANCSLPMIGRYHDAAFYLGDCDEEDTCSANDLFVNAWKELPKTYRGDGV